MIITYLAIGIVALILISAIVETIKRWNKPNDGDDYDAP